MVAWPGTLPQFVLRDGYQEGFKDTVLRSDMDSGPAKRRRRFTAAPEPHSFTMELTDAQVDLFRTFFDTTIEGGALGFDMTNPRTLATDTWAFTKTPDPVRATGWNSYTIVLDLELLP